MAPKHAAGPHVVHAFIGLPLSLSPFPQWSNLDVHKLEEDVRKQVISNGYREIVYHNRGL